METITEGNEVAVWTRTENCIAREDNFGILYFVLVFCVYTVAPVIWNAFQFPLFHEGGLCRV